MAGKINDNSSYQNINELFEKYGDTSSFKVVNQLLTEDQFWIQPACYALMGEMVNYREFLSKPYKMFKVLSTHDNPWIAGCAARGLGKTNSRKAVTILIELLNNRNNNFVFESSILALGDLKAHKAAKIISEALKQKDSAINIKEAAIKAIISIKDKNAIPAILSFLESSKSNEKDLSVKLMAIGAIAQYKKDEKVMDILFNILKDHSYHTYCRLAAAREIANSKNKETISHMHKFLKNSKEPKLKARIKEMMKGRNAGLKPGN